MELTYHVSASFKSFARLRLETFMLWSVESMVSNCQPKHTAYCIHKSDNKQIDKEVVKKGDKGKQYGRVQKRG
jgi:hypothetical protein